MLCPFLRVTLYARCVPGPTHPSHRCPNSSNHSQRFVPCKRARLAYHIFCIYLIYTFTINLHVFSKIKASTNHDVHELIYSFISSSLLHFIKSPNIIAGKCFTLACILILNQASLCCVHYNLNVQFLHNI